MNILWSNTSLQPMLQPALVYSLSMIFLKCNTWLKHRTRNKGIHFKHVRNQMHAWGEGSNREAQDSITSDADKIPQDTAECRFLKMNSTGPCL